MTTPDVEVEEQLAELSLGTTWADLPASVQQLAELLLLDALACAYTGADARARATFAEAARELCGAEGDHVVVGAGRESLGAAVLLNAWQTTATTMCDVYRARMCHVTPVVLPAVLSAAGRRPDLSREELLTSFLVAVEVTVRLCRAMDPALYQGARWHAPGVVGPYGAATAAGRLLGLDAPTLRRAWGAAGLQSAGTFASIGSPGVKTTQARGAWSGVAAVVLAGRGHGGLDRPFAHPDGGLFDAYGGLDPALAVEGLGEQWLASELTLRRWPASSSLQSTVEAVLALADGSALPEEMVVSLPPRSFALCATPGWDDQLTALQSARWVAGVVWTDRSCWLEQFAAERLADAALGAQVEARVRVEEDASVPDSGVRLAVTRGGRVDVAEVTEPLGSPSRPLDHASVLDKLTSATSARRAADLTDLVTGGRPWHLHGFLDLLAEEGRRDV